MTSTKIKQTIKYKVSIHGYKICLPRLAMWQSPQVNERVYLSVLLDYAHIAESSCQMVEHNDSEMCRHILSPKRRIW